MGKRILCFNIVYYTVIFLLIKLASDAPSSSLGYGYFIICFWIVAAIILGFLLIRKIICPTSILDKIGIFTATPVLSVIVISLILSFKEDASTVSIYTKQNYYYKVRRFHYRGTPNIKRIEYYRSEDASTWLKDSTWLYISESGDTLKKMKYKDDVVIK
jgi:hypothetical protein